MRMLRKQMKANARTEIKSAIKKTIFTYFVEHNFEEHPSVSRTVFGDSKTLFPLNCLKRYRTDGTLEIIEFQFAKYGGHRFQLQFARIPLKGAYHDFGYAVQNDCGAYGFGSHGTLQVNQFFNGIYCGKSLFRDFKFNKVCRNNRKALKLCEQIEKWFVTGEVGKHLRTREHIGFGITIHLGWRKFLVFRENSISFFKQEGGIITTREQAVQKANEILSDQKRALKIGILFPWRTIYQLR